MVLLLNELLTCLFASYKTIMIGCSLDLASDALQAIGRMYILEQGLVICGDIWWDP